MFCSHKQHQQQAHKHNSKIMVKHKHIHTHNNAQTYNLLSTAEARVVKLHRKIGNDVHESSFWAMDQSLFFTLSTLAGCDVFLLGDIRLNAFHNKWRKAFKHLFSLNLSSTKSFFFFREKVEELQPPSTHKVGCWHICRMNRENIFTFSKSVWSYIRERRRRGGRRRNRKKKEKNHRQHQTEITAPHTRTYHHVRMLCVVCVGRWWHSLHCGLTNAKGGKFASSTT